MPESLCNFPSKTRSQTNLLQPEDFALSSTPTKKIIYDTSTLATNDAKEMAKYPPAEVGTRGTVRSLLMQEIEYFSRLESNSQDWSKKNKSQINEMGSSGRTNSRATNVSTVASTKKKQGSSKRLPSMCSVVDVSHGRRPNRTSSFSYRNLKSDTKLSSLDDNLREP